MSNRRDEDVITDMKEEIAALQDKLAMSQREVEGALEAMNARHKDALRLNAELATILAERDAAVSMGTQLERELKNEYRRGYEAGLRECGFGPVAPSPGTLCECGHKRKFHSFGEGACWHGAGKAGIECVCCEFAPSPAPGTTLRCPRCGQGFDHSDPFTFHMGLCRADQPAPSPAREDEP
jgi:hypothetical protein